MNIQTVIANLLKTIEGKEQLLASIRGQLSGYNDLPDQMALGATVAFLEINIDELKKILFDCMAVREADIVKDLEIKDLKRQNSDYSWQVNPDRMGQ